jgi:hypothetical protein
MHDRIPARFERLPLADLRAPRLQNVLDLWQRKRGGRLAPARLDFDPAELKPVLACVTLVDVLYDPLDFRYRLVGSEMVRAYGRDVTSQSVNDLQLIGLRALIWRDLTELVKTAQPQYTALYYTNLAGHLRAYQLLRLPLSSDGARLDMLLLVAEFDRPAFDLRNLIDARAAGEDQRGCA